MLAVQFEGVEWFLLADSSVFASLSARLDSVKQEGTIVLDIHCFANMVGYRENLANQVDLLRLTMVMMKEMVVVTNLRREVDFATLYYIVENDIVEAEKKKLDLGTYLIVMAAIDGAD